MVATSLCRTPKQKLSSHQIWKEKHKKASLLLVAVAGAASVTAHASVYVDKECIHTSVFTGQRWLQELLEGKLYLISSFIWKSMSTWQVIQHIFIDNSEWSDLCSVDFSMTLKRDVVYKILSMFELKSNLQSSFTLPGLIWEIRRCKSSSKHYAAHMVGKSSHISYT